MKRRDEVAVGILITIAVIVLVLGTLWLARGGLKSGYPLYTRFQWGQNLKQGQPVLLAGVSVGYVGDVTLRRQGYLDVMLRVDDKYQVPKGSTAAVKAVGIFGDVAIALTPPTPVPAESYSPGDTVPPGPIASDVDAILSRVDSIGRAATVLMKAVQEQVIAAGTLKDLHRIVAATATLSTQLQGVVAEQNKNLNETGATFRNAADHFSKLADSARIGETMTKLREATESGSRLFADLDSTNTRLRTLVDQIQRGQGTVGRLAADSTLYVDMRRTLLGLDSLFTDLKANPRKYFNFSVFGGGRR
jgi:phospholipid/cholesterol/gamma-HCH transport system substrate-binding protein